MGCTGSRESSAVVRTAAGIPTTVGGAATVADLAELPQYEQPPPPCYPPSFPPYPTSASSALSTETVASSQPPPPPYPTSARSSATTSTSATVKASGSSGVGGGRAARGSSEGGDGKQTTAGATATTGGDARSASIGAAVARDKERKKHRDHHHHHDDGDGDKKQHKKSSKKKKKHEPTPAGQVSGEQELQAVARDSAAVHGSSAAAAMPQTAAPAPAQGGDHNHKKKRKKKKAAADAELKAKAAGDDDDDEEIAGEGPVIVIPSKKKKKKKRKKPPKAEQREKRSIARAEATTATGGVVDDGEGKRPGNDDTTTTAAAPPPATTATTISVPPTTKSKSKTIASTSKKEQKKIDKMQRRLSDGSFSAAIGKRDGPNDSDTDVNDNDGDDAASKASSQRSADRKARRDKKKKRTKRKLWEKQKAQLDAQHNREQMENAVEVAIGKRDGYVHESAFVIDDDGGVETVSQRTEGDGAAADSAIGAATTSLATMATALPSITEMASASGSHDADDPQQQQRRESHDRRRSSGGEGIEVFVSDNDEIEIEEMEATAPSWAVAGAGTSVNKSNARPKETQQDEAQRWASDYQVKDLEKEYSAAETKKSTEAAQVAALLAAKQRVRQNYNESTNLRTDGRDYVDEGVVDYGEDGDDDEDVVGSKYLPAGLSTGGTSTLHSGSLLSDPRGLDEGIAAGVYFDDDDVSYESYAGAAAARRAREKAKLRKKEREQQRRQHYIQSKYDSTPSIQLGPVSEARSSRRKRTPAASRVRDALYVSAQQIRTQRTVDDGERGDVVLEGPAPYDPNDDDDWDEMSSVASGRSGGGASVASTASKRRRRRSTMFGKVQKLDSEEDTGWWVVSVPLTLDSIFTQLKSDPDDSSGSDSGGGGGGNGSDEEWTQQVTQIESGNIRLGIYQTMRLYHGRAASLLQRGHFAEALEVMSDLLVAVSASTNNKQDWKMVGGGAGSDSDSTDSSKEALTLHERQALRNIGTVQLWNGDFEGARDTFWDVVAAVSMSTDAAKEEEYSLNGNGTAASQVKESAPDTAASLVFLGLALYANDEYEDANRIFLKTLSMTQRRPQHIESTDLRAFLEQSKKSEIDYTEAKLLNNVGCTFFELGFDKSACRCFHRAVLAYLNRINQASTRHLSDDVSVASLSSSVSHTLQAIKDFDILEETLPEPLLLDAAVALNNLAYARYRRKRSGVTTAMKEALSLQRKALGSEHSIPLGTMESLAHVYIKKKAFRDALKTYEDMLGMREESFSDPEQYHQMQEKLFSNMSYVYLKMGKRRKALECFAGVLAHQEDYLPPNHEEIQKTIAVMEQLEKESADF